MGFLRPFLSRQEWIYILSLLIPFIVYDLALKAAVLGSIPGVAPNLYLMRSNVFFDLGYVLMWIGLFAAVPRGGSVHRFVVVLFHITTILLIIVATSSYQYFKLTGATLNYSIIALWLPDLKEIGPVLTGSVPLSAWVLLLVALFYVTLGPWILTRTISKWREWTSRALSGTSRVFFLSALGLWILAFGFGLLSLLLGANWGDYPSGTSIALVRQPFVNVLLTGFEEASTAGVDDQSVNTPVEHPAAHATLAPTSQTQKRNVVLIHLESTRAEATTPYNSSRQTTPFLDELAKSSLLAERYYTTVEHTSKASVSVNCSIDPHLVQPVTEAKSGGIPVPCLASLLKDQGYNTAFFQSSTQDFEDFGDLVNNFGYEDYYPLESMNTDGFQRVNYFGYEDDIMLEPSQQWLEKQGDKPFLAEYLLGAGHHDYKCLDTSYGDENYSDDRLLNQYLNCMHLQDAFLQNLIDQYKDLGLYDDTIFVIYGDHGEGFGEHGLYVHDDIPYQEGLKVPLIIHAPGLLEGGQRVDGLSNHTDILPTVLDMLGYEVKDGEYPGYSLLHSLPEDRTLNFSCFHEDQCLASIEGDKEYIYHYGNRPDEVFDLSEDPLEQNDLASEYSKEELDKRRARLLKWQTEVNAIYTSTDG
ncbi:MAG: sulfatase-like hydrolase/transferase [Actinobacteria bacterium]|nr:sulfatase-like hydrolase/transferase [Actinomycetota bacterium]